MSKISEGLRRTYDVRKANGSPVSPNAKYFVLRYDQEEIEDEQERAHRDACRAAMQVYADHIESTLPMLAGDIRQELQDESVCDTTVDVEDLLSRIEDETDGFIVFVIERRACGESEWIVYTTNEDIVEVQCNKRRFHPTREAAIRHMARSMGIYENCEKKQP